LNHGLQASHFKYDGTNVHCLLAGTKYALIRQELIQGREVSQKGYKNLLVTLGGSDQEVLVQKVVDAVGLVKRSNLQVKILGSFSGSLAKKLRLVRLDSRKNIEICEPQLDLSNLYRWADLAVSAGGGTLWELCFYGVVGMVGVLSENQEAIAEALEEAGIFKSVGWYRSASSEKIADTLESLITHPEWVESTRQKALRLVDGKGAERVYEAMKRVEYENTAAYNRK
jgi:spore coat polysaccharide biosynthesis predicted glycosyltransferase SpsG